MNGKGVLGSLTDEPLGFYNLYILYSDISVVSSWIAHGKWIASNYRTWNSVVTIGFILDSLYDATMVPPYDHHMNSVLYSATMPPCHTSRPIPNSFDQPLRFAAAKRRAAGCGPMTRWVFDKAMENKGNLVCNVSQIQRWPQTLLPIFRTKTSRTPTLPRSKRNPKRKVE